MSGATISDTWERIIKDAREYRLNIGGSYLWTNKSDELVARCKALAGDCGVSTCHMEYCLELSNDELYPTEAYECSVCGEVTVEGKPNYCPSCGAKVMDK